MNLILHFNTFKILYTLCRFFGNSNKFENANVFTYLALAPRPYSTLQQNMPELLLIFGAKSKLVISPFPEVMYCYRDLALAPY